VPAHKREIDLRRWNLLQKLTPNLMVDNVNETVDYYRDVLGFELAMSNPEKGTFEWAMVQSGDVAFMFQTRSSLAGDLPLFKDVAIGGSLTFFVMTDDIEGLHKAVRDKADILQDMKTTLYGMREFCIRDCNGYVLTFAERV
jgi:lactoylglutathione lyase